MKFSAFIFSILLSGLFSCGSETADGNFRTRGNREIKEQIDPGTKASIDSVAQASSKGEIVFPVPDTLTSLLARHRPAASLASLPDLVIADKRFEVNNPVYITGDFNGNKLPDYAVQVLENDSIQVIAFLDYTGQAKEMKIANFAPVKLENGLYSTYKLKLAPKDSVVKDYRTQKPKALTTDGVVVLEENRARLYIIENNRFLPVQQSK